MNPNLPPSERLRILRVEHGLTQTALAKKINMAASTISLFESGQRPLSKKGLERLDNYFNGELLSPHSSIPNRMEFSLVPDGAGWKMEKYKLYCDE